MLPGEKPHDSSSESIRLDDYQLAARMLREKVRDKSYRAYPMGQRAGEYLRWKRGRLTESSYRDYESCLDKLAREFPDLDAADFEPPIGTLRVEEFLERLWGEKASRTYNKNLSILADFFKFLALRGHIQGDPTLAVQRHKKRDVHREIFRRDDQAAILAGGPSSEYLRRDRIALHLLLQFGIRKGALQKIQFRHFDQTRRKLTIFTKGQKIRELSLPDPALWDDLSKLQFEIGAEPHHFLMCSTRKIWRGYTDDGGSKFEHKRYPEKALSGKALHDWWYGCLERAGLVAKGTRSGEKMHKARHTAGQNMLDQTQNIKAVQMLLGHADPSTTMQSYVGWDEAQLEASLKETYGWD